MNTPKSPFAFLEQPYPFYYEGKKLWQITSMIFVAGLLFNYMLQPFNVNTQEQKMPYFWICAVHSAVPIIVLLCIAFVYGWFQKTTDDWKIKKECIFILFLIFFSGIGQFLIRDLIYDNAQNWSLEYLTEEILHSFIAGCFLGPIIISINLNRQQLKNQQKATLISSAINDIKEIQPVSVVAIETEVKSEKFTFDSNSFIYAKAEGNYLDIYLQKEGNVVKLTKRLTLTSLEKQLAPFSFILKTHRSVLLNLNYIENVSGNAQGYKVKLKNCPEVIPVSRNYISPFDAAATIR